MSPNPDIDFHRIRPYGDPPSRPDAYEELASILIEGGLPGLVEWPPGTRYERFGNPDGGREGRGLLPNGNIWAWQAKYLFEFDADAVGQLTRSLRRLFTTETNLKRVLIALPMDLPAGDTDGRTSAHTRWGEKVAEWKRLARDQGLDVDFDLVNAHYLLTALTEPRHAGRARYWFDVEVLTPDWQRRRLEDAVAKAGRRYSPQLHVAVHTADAIDGVGRTDAHLARWQQALAKLREARRWEWRAPDQLAGEFGDAVPLCITALDGADAALELMIAALRTTAELRTVGTYVGAAQSALRRVDDLLHQHSMTQDRYFVGDAASLYSAVRQTFSALSLVTQLDGSPTVRAAREKALLVTGRAGVGKTHLLCDVAARRIAEGRPTILLLGQDFDDRSFLAQLGELAQVAGPLDEVLGVLDAAAEAAGCLGLLMIDALNESERPERWRDDLRALIVAASRCPNLALVVACRTEFVDGVIGETPVARVEHLGFAEATAQAVQRFSREYGLEPPTFPVLNPEFGNPLFLKLTCEALVSLGTTRFPFGSAGITTILDAFLEAVNKRLAAPARGDYDQRTNPVARAVTGIALLGRSPVSREDAERITTQALPDRRWSRSLLHGLITEGVLTELGDDRIAFGYQRLGDMAHASAIAQNSLQDVRTWLEDLNGETWREAGVLGALAVIVPERYSVEIVDVVMDEFGAAPYDFVDHFLESLLLRSIDSVSARTIEIVERLLDGHDAGEVYDRLIRVSCVPGHPLNAGWLHAHLAPMEVADRDRSWSTWLVGAVEVADEKPLQRLLEWAWPAEREDGPAVVDDVIVAAVQLLGWCLTTSDRPVRDRATKALVSIGERAPASFSRALRGFHGTNDPYVVERLAAAACGVVLRTDDVDEIGLVADGLRELIGDEWPLHLLTRDYARRVFSVARTRGWSGPEREPPYGTQWPIPTRPYDEIKGLAGPPDYAYGSIWHSVTGMGDFGRYVLAPALRHVVSQDPRELTHAAERAVFDRALDLGWTPERFAAIDRGRSGDRDSRVERVGKKYQWIGLYETLGRIADNHPIASPWGDDEPAPYEYAEQLVWRDIDPTLLARKPARLISEPQWFSPTAARFPTQIATEYPTDFSGVPDPVQLIAVSDQTGAPWLVLISDPKWEQDVPPELDALRVPRLVSWMQLHAYLVPTGDADAIGEWAPGRDWQGAWMPDAPDVHNVLLGSHADDPGWSVADGSVDWWRTDRPPAELRLCTAWYGGTGTSRDGSAEDETRGYVPSRQLFDLLDLGKGVDFAWRDRAGLAVWDPSASAGGPASLVMRRDLSTRLTDAGFTLLWTVLAGKELQSLDVDSRGDYRWVSASASYLLTDGTVRKIGGQCARFAPGPTTEIDVEWITQDADS